MAAAKALSFPKNSNNSSLSSDESPLSWESFLPNHAIFKVLDKCAQEAGDESNIYNNVLAEMHGDLFLWKAETKEIFVANLKNLKAKNERSSKLQVVCK